MNTTLKKTAATLTLLALPATAIAATTVPASADTERHGRCGTGGYELSVDREGRGYEVNVDLDRVTPGSTWTLALRHEGKRYVKVTRTADAEGDLDLETFRRGTPGNETFAFTAKRVGGTEKCGTKVTVR